MKKADSLQALVVAQPTITDAVAILDGKIRSMKHIADSVYVTSGKISGINGTVDIKTETKVHNLIVAHASVREQVEAIEKSYDEFGIKGYPVVKVDGSTLEEWKKDIKLRIDIIENEDNLKKLQEYKSELESLMDKEDRKTILFQKMQAEGIA